MESSKETPKSELELDPRIKLISGDITTEKADAIVCPSLPELEVLKTGVAGAIYRKGGAKIFEEAEGIGDKAHKEHPDNPYPVPLTSAHITSAGELPNAKHVIHSVSVDVVNGRLECNPEIIFKSAYNVLRVADQASLQSVAFPALGSGLYQVPEGESLGAIASAATEYFKDNPQTNLNEVKLITLDPSLPKLSPLQDLVLNNMVAQVRANRN